jgi:hypothetical protein
VTKRISTKFQKIAAMPWRSIYCDIRLATS